MLYQKFKSWEVKKVRRLNFKPSLQCNTEISYTCIYVYTNTIITHVAEIPHQR